MRSETRSVALTALGATVVTATVVVVPAIRFAAVLPELRTAMDMAQAMVGALVAYLLFGWYRRTHVVNHLAVSYALALTATSNFYAALLPALTDTPRGRPIAAWVPLAARVVSCVVLAVAALTRDRQPVIRHPARLLVLALASSSALIVAIFVPLAAGLPVGVEVLSDPSDSRRPRLEAEPVLLGLQLVLAATYAAAAIGFLRRARPGAGGLTTTLAVACTLGVFVRLNYFLYPSIYSDLVHVGDFFRLAFFFVLLVGAAREINEYWAGQSHAMAVAERQRLARELQDGLTQDLAFIRSHTSSLAAGHGHPEMIEHVATAAGRALAESRRVVSALSTPVDGTLREALEFVARSVAVPEGTVIQVDAPDLEVEPPVREHLAWIAREALNNAVHHGGARFVTVQAGVTAATVHVTVTDNGCGFDVERAKGRTEGTGIRAMRDRATALHGELSISSRRGSPGGTYVEVRIPAPPAGRRGRQRPTR